MFLVFFELWAESTRLKHRPPLASPLPFSSLPLPLASPLPFSSLPLLLPLLFHLMGFDIQLKLTLPSPPTPHHSADDFKRWFISNVSNRQPADFSLMNGPMPVFGTVGSHSLNPSDTHLTLWLINDLIPLPGPQPHLHGQGPIIQPRLHGQGPDQSRNLRPRTEQFPPQMANLPGPGYPGYEVAPIGQLPGPSYPGYEVAPRGQLPGPSMATGGWIPGNQQVQQQMQEMIQQQEVRHQQVQEMIQQQMQQMIQQQEVRQQQQMQEMIQQQEVMHQQQMQQMQELRQQMQGIMQQQIVGGAGVDAPGEGATEAGTSAPAIPGVQAVANLLENSNSNEPNVDEADVANYAQTLLSSPVPPAGQ